jgi:hypothetical protein
LFESRGTQLATTTWETTVLVTVERTATNHKGKILTDKHGRPVRVKHRHWQHSMEPVDEVGHGKGRRDVVVQLRGGRRVY